MITTSSNDTKLQKLYKITFLNLFFCYQRECPETMSTKKFLCGTILQKFIVENELFNFLTYSSLINLLMIK